MLSLTLDHLRGGGKVAAEQLLSQTSLDAVQETLFAALIPTAIASQRRDHGRRRYTRPDAQRWLSTLAAYLITSSDSGTEVGLHEIWSLANGRRTSLLTGLVTGIVSGFTFGSWIWLLSTPAAGLLFGSVQGLGCTLMNGMPLTRRPLKIIISTHRKGAQSRRIKGGCWAGLAFGLFGALGAVTGGSGLMRGLIAGPELGLVAALIAALAFGLPAWAIPAQRARTVIRDDTLAIVTCGLTAGLGIGLLYGLVNLWWAGLIGALTAGLFTALAIGLATGMSLGQVTIKYLIAANLFRIGGRFTTRPAPFLDWANHAGLLRTTGIRYQFRHETYRDWLVGQAASPPTDAT